MKSCTNCKYKMEPADKPPCYECKDAGGFGNWEPNEENAHAKKIHDFLEKCDELDAAVFTGDVLLHMNKEHRAEFWDFVSGWVNKFMESEDV